MKYEIEIEGLPEGWKPVAYRRPVFGEYYFYNDDIQQGKTGSGQFLIVEKIKPRRIVLEETEEDANCELLQPMTGGSEVGVMVYAHRIWRLVEEE